ncbi:AAA family ATPase [Leifsonia sp. F6_8S_P_1B]|uniref:AAA family ATPase n=1 Tax=Leifsonia williamsii TaxID=3035919 RepID=A0ABT8KCG8_9MICO|nr:AAA family ATPase [Leifsonia williamsii]MDN4615141.1 AAA family ATPase [Leifsonia williamsii]
MPLETLHDGIEGLADAKMPIPGSVWPSPTIRRVVLKNFKSIEACDVPLSRLTLLVGPNGSGKSNFIDGIRLTRDALQTNLENAIRDRGGIVDVRRRSTGHPTHFGVRYDIDTPSGHAEYAYQVSAKKDFTFEVQKEVCRVYRREELVASFQSVDGVISSTGPSLATVRVARNSLALSVIGGLTEYEEVAVGLRDFGFYNFNPNHVRDLQSPDMGEILTEDGSNLASVIRRLREMSPRSLDRVTEYLGAVVPGIRSIAPRSFGPKETVEFKQDVVGDQRAWSFLASNVSDGTLRALCVLVAAFQENTPLVSIEEPETAVHPGAAHRLMDALLERSKKHQLLLTTHSPDLLDHPSIDVDSVLAVQSDRGKTTIGQVDPATRMAAKENLYTVGELLRLEQVKPDVFAKTTQKPASLF